MLNDDPKHSMVDWRAEVWAGDTRLGYDDWLSHKRDEDEGEDLNEIVEVLCDAGEEPLGAEVGEILNGVVNAAGCMLEGLCANNTVVVKTKSGRYFIGEVGFEFVEVDEDEAQDRAGQVS